MRAINGKNRTVSRREFLEFLGHLGKTGVALSAAGPLFSLNACSRLSKKEGPIATIEPSSQDELLLAKGLEYNLLARWGDQITKKGDLFGTHCDFTAFMPDPKSNDHAFLWVNHEYVDSSLMLNRPVQAAPKTKTEVERELDAVGASWLRIEKKGAQWTLSSDTSQNRRLTGRSWIPIHSERPIRGKKQALGTCNNCGGGVTPWGTILTCEENYADDWGERIYENGQPKGISDSKGKWGRHFEAIPEHYGWVVEYQPKTGSARKLTPLGRFPHEGALVVRASNGKTVVYMGEDRPGGGIFKFISDQPDSLESGTLYVADTKQGRWIPLRHSEHTILRKNFKDQTDVLVRASRAAELVGGTPQDRPEGIARNPKTGAILIALTKGKEGDAIFGSILKIEETASDPLATSFKADSLLVGGPEAGFANPDNLTFDPRGNLWMVTDISSSKTGKGPFAPFKNNGLFYIPLSGPHSGQIFQVGSGPVGAELTGPTFTPDGRTLFLSVQHPGEVPIGSGLAPTSKWPYKKPSKILGEDPIAMGKPRSSVVAIHGDFFEKHCSPLRTASLTNSS